MECNLPNKYKIDRTRIQSLKKFTNYSTNLNKPNIYFRIKNTYSMKFDQSQSQKINNTKRNIQESLKLAKSLSLRPLESEKQLKQQYSKSKNEILKDFNNKKQNKSNQKIKNDILNAEKEEKQYLNKSKNDISGTNLGSLSTNQILRKYEIKKINQILHRKQFLDKHIKSLKINEYDSDTDSQQMNTQTGRSKISQNFNLLTSVSNHSARENSLSLGEKQHKLLKLLQNKLSDRDYIDFNVKLLSKKEPYKRKFFARYFNILSKKRQQIINQ